MSEGLLSKRQQIVSIGEDVEKRETLYTIDGTANWCSHYEDSLKKLKIELTRNPNSTPQYLSKENENTNLKRYMPPCAHCSIIHNS